MCWTHYKSQVFGIPSIQYLQWSAMATLYDAQSFCEPFGTYQWGMILQVQRNGLTLKGCGLSNLGWGRFKVIPPTGKFTKKKSLDGTPPQAVHDISSGVVQKQWLVKMVNKFSLLICKSQYFASCYTPLSCRLPVFALTALRFWPWHRSPMMASAAAPSGQDGWFHESVTSGFIQTILVYISNLLIQELVKKPSRVHLLRSEPAYQLLDDIVKSYMLSDPDLIPAVRDREDCQ